ncbi:type II toxin-antitoxin system RelE/ParE family toxin [Flavobacterium restrictum]|uniref:Type II toxin-antitoxin system RelE/ParE family toxin n=1 Tax=Flavobacterium restrictum TaxID=2594428 RepID=A0A553E4S4_9FLAO|nr:type II toxin-antitoxin system RelE/ParE family toxin [Flavobacterium restrictum]TRX40027.1 type II toxin-antitoxin system RelE/ParE family toxin [Flavobacterium restrictum]
MKCKKVISESAKLDIIENTLWYNTKRKGLGKEFAVEIRKTVNYISDFLLAFPVKYDAIRVAVVRTFPYTIHYYFDQPNNTIFISCVFHDANDPEILNRRSSI